MNKNFRLKIGTALVAALALIAGVGIVLAQGPPDPNQMVERQLENMKDRLKLTGDQEKKLKPILLESMKKMMEMRQKFNMEPGQPPSEEAMAAMKKNREESNKKIAEVLTKEQQAEYEKMLSERRGFGGKKKQQ